MAPLCPGPNFPLQGRQGSRGPAMQANSLPPAQPEAMPLDPWKTISFWLCPQVAESGPDGLPATPKSPPTRRVPPVSIVGSVHFWLVPWSDLYFSRSIGAFLCSPSNHRVLIYCLYPWDFRGKNTAVGWGGDSTNLGLGRAHLFSMK